MVVCMLVFFVIYFNLDIVSSTTACGKPHQADIGFLMDDSGSVGYDNFLKNLEFVNKFVNLFDIGDDAVKLSAFAFNSDVGDGFYFSCCNDKTSVQNRISNIIYSNGGTEFEPALAFAKDVMFQKSNGARDSALKMLFFFTDGQASVSNTGELLKQQGIRVYAIGVGSYVDINQLHQIAYNSSYVFMISDYYELITSVFNSLISKACDEIVINACERINPPCEHGACISTGATYICLCENGYTGVNCEIDIDYCVGVECHHGGTCIDGLTDYTCKCHDRYIERHCDIDICMPFPADVVIVMDSSTSMGEKYFNISKNTVLKITKNMQFSPNHFQVAVLSTADRNTIDIGFIDSMNNETFTELVSNLKLKSGTSNLPQGLNYATTVLSARKRFVGQTPVRKFIIILSDGLISSPRFIQSMTRNDIEVLAVAIGEDVSHYWLSKITGSGRFVFPHHDGKLWNYIVNTLVDQSCNVCHVHEENDILVAVDNSKAFSHDDLLKTIPSILNKMTSGILLGPFKTKLALVTFSTKAEVIFSFNEFNETNKFDMQRQLSYFTHSNSTSANITAMLEYTSKYIMDPSSGARLFAKKKLVVLSGFNEKVSPGDKGFLDTLHNADVDIYTIGLHNTNAEFQIMSEIATTSFHIGIEGGVYFNSIDTFIASFHEQLYTFSCKLD